MKKLYLIAVTLMALSVTAAAQADTHGFAMEYSKTTISPTDILKPESNPTSLKKVSRATDEIIEEAPGEKYPYSLSSASLVNNYAYVQESAANISIDGDDYYIPNPISVLNTQTYAKATRIDDKLCMDLPQTIYLEQGEGYSYTYVINKMVLQDEETMTYADVDPEENYIEYVIADDGSITMDLGNDIEDTAPTYVLGVTYAEYPGYWLGYGDFYQKFTPNNEEVTVAPDDLEWEHYGLQDESHTYLIECGLDGTDMYIRGLFYEMPEAVVKGKFADNVLTLPSVQYLGIYESYMVYTWLLCTDRDGVIADACFVYDDQDGTFSCQSDTMLWFNVAPDEVYYIDYLLNPVFTFETEDDMNANPMNPYPTKKVDLSSSMGICGIQWAIPNVNVNNYVLNSDHLSCQLYFNDELFTAYTDEYGIPEDMDRFPMNFRSSDGYIFSGINVMALYVYFTGIETISCQSFYEGSDGFTYTSDKVTYYWEDLTLGIVNPIDNEKEEKSVLYYDLQGKAINNPTKGLYIKQTIFTDGSSTAHKIFIH